MENRILDVAELAPLLCISPRTLRNKLCAEPNNLPPRVKVPGTKGPRWRLSDVQQWMDALPLSPDAVTVTDAPPARRGRRRKMVR
ncbi:hypothetical protein HF673_00075 [Acidithiobacillus thiooxidans]|uniref:helix-turn-helix transcriptional regulator n=1 Tax=Acidithiobacillus thiooxidans TaxID=930 RepID=UPI001C06F77D|nr:hypothetical protein [Acidithiobacillus thiooxidans]MBU2834213.1 hypothetical protein [Acidithiobacillus thiooxidans]